MRGVRALLPWLLFAALLVAAPYLFPGRLALSLLNTIGVYLVLALSYNMLLGQGGMLSFGHAVYYGLGGFGAIHLMAAIKAHGWGVPIHLVPLAGFAAGLVAGVVIGWPSCRRAGTPFAMISLGIGELVAAAALMFTGPFGGEEGISADRGAGPAFLGLNLGPIGNVYWFVASWAFVAALAMWAFTRTPLGRMSNAVRDNPDRVSFVGFDPMRVRYLVFIIAGGFAGLAGGMAAVTDELMTPSSLGATVSATVLLMAFIGGTGVFYGPILGAGLLTLMRSMLSDYTEGWQLYVGLLFVAVVMFAPGGLAGLVESLRRLGAEGALARRGPALVAGLVSGIVALAGTVVLVEMALRVREGGRGLHAFGITLDPGDPSSWLVGAGLLALGAAGLRLAPRIGPRERPIIAEVPA